MYLKEGKNGILIGGKTVGKMHYSEYQFIKTVNKIAFSLFLLKLLKVYCN